MRPIFRLIEDTIVKDVALALKASKYSHLKEIFGFRIFGLGQPLADTIKLLFKEDFIPAHVNRLFYLLAPVISASLAIVAVMGLPFGSFVSRKFKTASMFSATSSSFMFSLPTRH